MHMLYDMVIWDHTISHAICMKMGNGSISHNWEAFTAFFLMFAFRSHLVAKKKVILLQILGKLKGEVEEEPEGEDLGEDSTGNN